MNPHINTQQPFPMPNPQQALPPYPQQEGHLGETQSQTTPESQPQTTPGPELLQLVPSPNLDGNGKNALDSSVIDKNKLPLTTAEALKKYEGLLTDSKASTLGN